MFDARNGKMKWKFETAGDIKASATFAPEKNLVIFGSFDNNLYLLDIDTGELKGKFETKDYIYSTPRIFKDNVYFTSTDKQLYSLNLNTGKLNWRFTAGGRILSSPEIVEGNVLFGSNNGIMYEVDIMSGKCQSIFQTAERITNKIVYNPETKRYFLSTYANEIFCLEKVEPSS
jgi:outer membrane protein assembly factor BamB